MKNLTVSRRRFLAASAVSLVAGGASRPARATAFSILPTRSPNEKLNIAGIGVGGKGQSDIDTCSSENIVALCDVDWHSAGAAFDRYPHAKRYKDFRQMLDECREIEAVTISTPDHMHAPAAMLCMQAGKHVYVQKPLAHTVQEARALRECAHEHGVATQMGNQGAATDLHREICELVWSGVIGPVREVRTWTDRAKGWWPQGISNALPEQPVPEHLDWDLWQGPAPVRPYNEGYCPFKWRGWMDFGSGALGDIACHSLSPVVKALLLEYPTSVECLHQRDANEQTFPTETILRYEFPERGHLPPVTLLWHDGGLKPNLPEGVDPAAGILDEDNGILFVGDKGLIVVRGRTDENILVLDGHVVKDFDKPEPILPRLPHIPGTDGHKQFADRMHKIDWIVSCKAGTPSGSDFDHAGPLAEWVQMGNISLRYPGRKLMWNGPAMRFENCEEANRYVTKEYRKGWEIL